MHDEIRYVCSPENIEASNPLCIYSALEVAVLLDEGKYDFRRLSIMKQENIRDAAETSWCKLSALKEVVSKPCGYCFKYRKNRQESTCHNCPLNCCADLKSFSAMESATSIKDFIAAHKEWCNELGFTEVYGGE